MARSGSASPPRFIGVVPAAGRGTRLAPLRYPKELLPIAYESIAGRVGEVRVRAVAEYAIDAIAQSGTGRILLVVAPWKFDIVTYFGDGRHLGVEIGYLYQESPRGLAHALDLTYEWTRGQHVVFAMPDTVFTPRDALARLRERYLRAGADLALAVFPTNEAERLGPVIVHGGQVCRVLDKVADPPVRNTWGAAIWGDAFADLLHAELLAHESDTQPVLGTYFDLAVRSGLRVVAQEYRDGLFEDAGTPSGVLRCLTWPGSGDSGPRPPAAAQPAGTIVESRP